MGYYTPCSKAKMPCCGDEILLYTLVINPHLPSQRNLVVVGVEIYMPYRVIVCDGAITKVHSFTKS